jgi:hypothetical protein
MEISDLNDIIADIIIYLENFCIAFNQYAHIYFIVFKFVFVFVLLGCGILTFLKVRGIYFKSKVFPKANLDIKTDPLTKPRLIVGTIFVVMGSGILFNYLIYFLIWLLEPIPDRLIFSFFCLEEIDPFALNRISNINMAIYPHEKTIYYVIAIASFINTIYVFFSIFLYLNKVDKPRNIFFWLTSAIPGGILFGFTTFMPLML